MHIAMCLEPVENEKWHHSLQMGVKHAVSIRYAGEDEPLWDYVTLARLKKRYEDFGLELGVIEGWLPFDAVRTGRGDVETEFKRIETTIQNMGALGIDVLCYSWMAINSWMRTSVTTRTRGGALTSSYDHSLTQADPSHNGPLDITEDELWGTLEKFLKRVVPVAEKAGVKLAIHPDDPPLSPVMGVGRIMRSPEAFEKAAALVPSEANGYTFCQGNFAAMGCDVPATIRRLGKDGLIHFVHFRDTQGTAEKFYETFHDDGPTDMLAAMQAYYDIGFKGLMRPDHAPVMYGEENTRPGYMALGRLFAVGYMKGLIEAVRAGKGPSA